MGSRRKRSMSVTRALESGYVVPAAYADYLRSKADQIEKHTPADIFVKGDVVLDYVQVNREPRRSRAKKPGPVQQQLTEAAA